MARRAGAVPFIIASSRSINETNSPSSSSALDMERSGVGYKPLELTSGNDGAGDDPRSASEEGEVREMGSASIPRPTVGLPSFADLMQGMWGEKES